MMAWLRHTMATVRLYSRLFRHIACVGFHFRSCTAGSRLSVVGSSKRPPQSPIAGLRIAVFMWPVRVHDYGFPSVGFIWLMVIFYRRPTCQLMAFVVSLIRGPHGCGSPPLIAGLSSYTGRLFSLVGLAAPWFRSAGSRRPERVFQSAWSYFVSRLSSTWYGHFAAFAAGLSRFRLAAPEPCQRLFLHTCRDPCASF